MLAETTRSLILGQSSGGRRLRAGGAPPRVPGTRGHPAHPTPDRADDHRHRTQFTWPEPEAGASLAASAEPPAGMAGYPAAHADRGTPCTRPGRPTALRRFPVQAVRPRPGLGAAAPSG